MLAEKDVSVFFRPHGNLLEIFQFTEEIFNQMPPLIHLLAILTQCLTVTARRDNHFTAAFCQILRTCS